MRKEPGEINKLSIEQERALDALIDLSALMDKIETPEVDAGEAIVNLNPEMVGALRAKTEDLKNQVNFLNPIEQKGADDLIIRAEIYLAGQ